MLPIPRDWPEWGRMFTDVSLWTPAVRQICRETGTAAARTIEAGYPGSCAVFVVDRRVVVKVFPPRLHEDFGRELEVYQLLAGRISRALPALLAEGTFHDRIDWPYLVLEFRPGRPIREVRQAISPANRLSLARELGALIRAVHQTPLGQARHFDTRPEAWQAFIAGRKAACLEELRREAVLPEAILAEAAALLAGGEPGLPAAFRPRLLNADLTEDHLLLVEEGGAWRISALVDWADAEAGAVAYEWVALWFGLCGRDTAMFRQTLQAYDPAIQFNEAFSRRMLAYTFIHRFGAGIIAEALRRPGTRPAATLDDLRTELWPV